MLKTFAAVLAANLATLLIAFMLLSAYASTQASWDAVDRADRIGQPN